MKCPVLVSRDAELAHLGEALERAIVGSGSTVVLAGEPGIGKSRTAGSVVELAAERGLVVLSGRAVRASTPTPLRPLREALLGWLRRNELPDEPLLNAFRPSLARLAPQLRSEGSDEQATSLVLLGEGLLRLCATLGEGRGCLLLVEDLHWADPETLAVLEYLADNLADASLLVVATTRTDESPDTQQLIDVLSSRGSAQVLELDVLDRDDTARMVGSCLDGQAPDEVVEFIRGNAGGLPLLVEELLTGMQSAGALTHTEGAWTVTAALGRTVPLSFARTVQQRLSSLAPDLQHLARAAAVLGAEFDWSLLPGALETDEQVVLTGLRQLVEQQLVVPGEAGFGFRHALTRDAILATALPPERASLAERLAEAVSRDGVRQQDHQTAAELYELAGDPVGAATEWCAAGAQSLEEGALATATKMLARAADLVPANDSVGLDIRETLLVVLAHAGDSAEAMRVGTELLADLEARDTAVARLARVRLELARAARAGGLLDEAAALLDGMELLDPAATAVLRAGVELGRFNHAEAVAQANLALATAGTGRPDLACEAWEVIGKAERGADMLRAEEAFEEGLRLADKHGLGHWRSRMLHELAAVDLTGRRPTEERFLAARAAALETGALATAAQVDLNLNIVRIRYLELDRAMAAADASIEQMTRLRLPMLGPAYVLRAFAQGLAGRTDAMEADLASGRRVAAPDDAITHAGVHAHVRAPVALSQGRYEEARAEFALGMEIYRRHPGITFSMRGLWALLETVLGDGEAAREEVRGGERALTPHNWFALRYADAVALGRAGRSTEAEQVFADAEWSLPGPEPWIEVHARGLVARGAAADGWGDPVLWFRQTLDGLVDAGQTAAASVCRAAMREAGIPVPRKVQGGRRVPPHLQRLGVSPREYDVFLLVVEGLTNQAIAEKLFLSARTVEVHVARLLQRTGSSSRGDLGAHRAEPVG